MRAALSLAARGLGQVWPNPAVGCVLVGTNGAVIGRGWTQKGGRPHAEAEALRQAGGAARGASAYVSLEPCAHHGQTPPCAEALIEAGIARCVVAVEDPDPRASGAGIRRLREAGMSVTTGVLEAEATAINRGFFTSRRLGRPLVALKLATTLDGKIATASGNSRWITGEPARDFGHRLRATHDAILVGSGTVLADDPELSCRLAGLTERSPIRVILDRRGRVPASAKVFSGGPEAPTWVLTTDSQRSDLASKVGKGLEFIEIKQKTEDVALLAECLEALCRRGLTRILLEGGAKVAGAFIKAKLVDRIYWFRSPGILGGDGLAGVPALGMISLEKMPRFHRTELRRFGDDVLEVLDLTA